MTKRIVILKGSPRKQGNSSILADRAAEGARSAGAEVKEFFLHGMDIAPCNACDLCRETGDCVIQDDMQEIYPALLAADAILLASPVYWFNYSAQLKLCVDRWYALDTSDGNKLKGKRIGILLTYGDVNLHAAGGENAVHSFENMFRYIHAPIIGVVHGSANNLGDIEKQPLVLQQAFELGKQLVM